MDLLLDNLLTEERNTMSTGIDLLPTEEMLKVINLEDQKVAQAVAREIPRIARAVDIVTKALKKRGRLIYVGAGTSGRLGILDACECVPTFNLRPEVVQGVMAGGTRAIYKSVEASEDNEEAGERAMKRKKITFRDVVVGIAASGRTPFTLGAMRYGKSIGAKVISVTCNPNSKMAEVSAVSIAPVVGPEVVTGSTRMKSGTAQKLVLNMISTATMIKLGYVYGNLMIQVQMKNEKLRERGRKIIMSAAGVDHETAEKTLTKAKGNIKVAILMLKKSEAQKAAFCRLRKAHMNLRVALEME